MTLEEAQEQILELTEQLEAEKSKVVSFENNNKSLADEVERLRGVNQRYFEKLTAQVLKDDPEPEPDPISLEEYAKTINI